MSRLLVMKLLYGTDVPASPLTSLFMNVRNGFFDRISHVRGSGLVLLKAFGQTHGLNLDVGVVVVLEILVGAGVEDRVISCGQ